MHTQLQEMTSTVAPNTTGFTNSSPSSNTTINTKYHPALLGIYIVVLASGLICLTLTIHIMKSSTASITSIAVLNLIFTHLFFLLTVPFRIYYYSTSKWEIGSKLCKAVSSMIHIHMYMSFIFYTIILVTRLWSFYRKTDRIASFQRLHALIVSAGVWTVVLVIGPCVVAFTYGQNDEKKEQCFAFGSQIEAGAKGINYIISSVIIVVTSVLMALQANVLLDLYKTNGQTWTTQQDFSAQLKSLCFVLIMVISFIPYHIFRLYYIEHIELEAENEVFLSLTTFNCLDMLTFLGRRTCFVCSQGKAV